MMDPSHKRKISSRMIARRLIFPGVTDKISPTKKVLNLVKLLPPMVDRKIPSATAVEEKTPIMVSLARLVRSLTQVKSKAKQILIPENTCQPEKMTFRASGALEAIKGTDAKLFRPKPNDYKSVEVPKGKICTEAKVERDLMEADCLINMPVAKHHSGATLTISMKNWMGAVDNGTRRAWHRNGLHQCIADLSTFLKPHLVVIDATRIMLDHGPQGPGKLAHPNEIIFATDPVAADTYAASLFKKTPDDVPYIKIASEMGIGCCDIKKIKVERVEVEA